MDASVHCCTDSYRIDEVKLIRIVNSLTRHLGVSEFQVHVRFVDRREIFLLNQKHRQAAKDTDVLSFPQTDWASPLTFLDTPATSPNETIEPPKVLGDIVISLPNAEDNANAIGHNLDREVSFLLVHGMLHLCGHDHESAAEEDRMIEQQKKLMAMLTSRDSEPLWVSSVRRIARFDRQDRSL